MAVTICLLVNCRRIQRIFPLYFSGYQFSEPNPEKGCEVSVLDAVEIRRIGNNMIDRLVGEMMTLPYGDVTLQVPYMIVWS